jgi:23S rRNA (uracil747-C5)-methyltransferase
MSCIYFNKNLCKSCELLYLSIQEEVQLKENDLKTKLSENQLVHPELDATVVGERFSERLKAKMTVLGSIEEPILGILQNNEKSQDLSLCPLYPKDFNLLFESIKEFIKISKLQPYDYKNDVGELKYIIIQQSHAFHHYMIRFVLRSKESIDRIKKNQNFLFTKFAIQTMSINIQPDRAAILEGEEEILISKETHLKEKLGNNYFFLAPGNFFQTNPKIASELYQTAFDWLKPLLKFSLLDLYCGVGGFSSFLYPLITKHIGIEINSSSINSAKKSQELNNQTLLNFKSMDSSLFLDEFTEEYDVIVVNPPRAGLNEKVALKLIKLMPTTILYSSCNSTTLVRDLKLLSQKYEIKKIKIFNMFPGTNHYETLVYLKLIIH